MSTRTIPAQITTDGPTDSGLNSPESQLETPVDTLSIDLVNPAILKALEYISPDTISNESKVIGNGTFGDVTMADYTHPRRGEIKVAIKYLRIFNPEEVITLFEREIYVWSKINHPNVLPLIGFFFNNLGYPSFVSEWMGNGSAWKYVNKKPDHDLNRLVIGAAEGLTYLHKNDVIHSDIKPDNIVVTSRGDACICDFGGSRIIAASKSLARPTASVKGTQIYCAPELIFLTTNNGHTKETDVWAFGMTLYALLTHKHPYINDPQVYESLRINKLPTFPSSESWSSQRLEAKETFERACHLCWEFIPAKRASMPLILSTLQTSLSPKPVSRTDVNKTGKENSADIKVKSSSDILKNDTELVREADSVSPKASDSESAASSKHRTYSFPELNVELNHIHPSANTYSPQIDTESAQRPRSCSYEGERSYVFGSLPSVKKSLSSLLEIGERIHNELKNLDASLVAERELGEEASYVIRDVVMYGKNLTNIDKVNLTYKAKQMKKVENAAREIEEHIVTASQAWARHLRIYGRKLADLVELNFENTTVASLKKQISAARSELITELGPFLVRWVKREDLDGYIDGFKNMVPCGPAEVSGDGLPWFIVRVPYFGGKQPGKFRPGKGAYFGFGGELHTVNDMNFEVLVAEPNSVRWIKRSGAFSEESLRPVKGCHEADGTELVIARARVKEHIFNLRMPMTLQLGKASLKLEGAYVTAGKREIRVQDYEVLVYA